MNTKVPQEFLDLCFEFRGKSLVSPIFTGFDSGFIDTENVPIPWSKKSDAELEARTYYTGVPTRPILVFRTGQPWQKPSGLEAYCVRRELRPVFDSNFAAVWEEMGTRIYEYLDSVMVKWTTIDVVRFAEDEKRAGHIVLWIGVVPGSLLRKDAEVAAAACEKILSLFQIFGVEIAFRESIFRRFGPKLLDYIPVKNLTPRSSDPPAAEDKIASVSKSLTPALGLPIACITSQYQAEGTGALYLSEGPNNEKVYILTARHVVFPPKHVPNQLYHRLQSRQERIPVILPGPRAFQEMLASTMDEIFSSTLMVDSCKDLLETLQEKEDSGDAGGVKASRAAIMTDLKAYEASIEALDKFHSDTTKIWSQERVRGIGHVAYAPPITVHTGAKRYTEDWALIELDSSKIDRAKFRGNVIDLGAETTLCDFVAMIGLTEPCLFEYPFDRLFPVQGIVPEDELFLPQMHNKDGEPLTIVIKNGSTTGTTIGRSNGIKSFVRDYLPDGIPMTTMELAIFSHGRSSVAFSKPGDSGSIIVDSIGRAAAMLTGGTGGMRWDFCDISYGTPFEWIFERIRDKFQDIHLYQTSTADHIV